jgi:thymidylate synthase (FAD)|tara:strand:- start:1203 stop:1931 length:729 start_codon:yes stop_codon:yes gene_type:complete
MNKTEIDLYKDSIGKVQYIQHVGSCKTIVNSARVSFGQDNDKGLTKRDEKLIRYLIKHKHVSTLEHNMLTVKVVVPMFVARQHMRHRSWNFNEISRRYTDVNIQFYEPDKFRTQHESNRQASNAEELINPAVGTAHLDLASYMKANGLVKRHHRHCLKLFTNLVEAGVCREQARGVLPQNLYTEYYATCSLRSLLHFIEARTHEGAQWEITKVAEAMLELAEDLWPEVIVAWKENKQNESKA